MNWKRLVPRSVICFYFNRKAAKGLKGVNIEHSVDLRNVQLSNYNHFSHHSQANDSSFGERTSVGRYTKIAFAHIGKYCSISWDVTIGAISHPLHSISSHAFSYRKQFGLCDTDQFLKHDYVEIGNDVWIGTGVIIMPGIHIGNGAVVGGGSIVTHPVADYEIVAGSPARHIGWRFEDSVREELQKIEWWNYSDEVLRDNIDLFSPFNDITKDTKIINKLKEIKQ